MERLPAQHWVGLALYSLVFSLWLWEDAGVARPEEKCALCAELEPGGGEAPVPPQNESVYIRAPRSNPHKLNNLEKR